MNDAVRVSAVLHTYNEEEHLEECLKSVRWCDEVLVIDLGSKDRSVVIAEEYADRVLHHEWVPIADQIRSWSYAQAKHDWLLCVDPDEVYPRELGVALRNKLAENVEYAAIIRSPWHFYFKGKPLTGCMWYPNIRLSLQNRNKVIESGLVHTGPRYEGEVIDIKWGEAPAIIHYWNDTWKAFIKSHWRYIKLEGGARYKHGKRFGVGLMLTAIWKMFRLNLVDKKGYKSGVDGILLSFAMGMYEAGAQLSLLKYQWDLKRGRIQ